MIALTADDQATLLRWARAAIVAGKPVAGQGELTPGLRAPAAAFVRLRVSGLPSPIPRIRVSMGSWIASTLAIVVELGPLLRWLRHLAGEIGRAHV